MGTVRELRENSGVPVNVIEADEPVDVEISTHDVREALATLVARTGLYRSDTVVGRYVLFPADPVWDSIVSGIDIVDVPRLQAATRYATAVRSRIPALEDLVEPAVKGDPLAPVYTEPVTLSPVSSVLTHLVELLGANEQLAFTIERTLSGKRMLHFQEVLTRRPPASGDDLD